MNICIDDKGISLVVLVVTIIVLLILAGVSIGSFSNSIIDRAELASSKMTDVSEKEKNDLMHSDLQILKYSNGKNLLTGNVRVGDYIDYPIEYNDAYTNEHYTGVDGWRVIDDGVMDGTSGNVRIISSHIPAKFYYNLTTYNNVDNVINDLMNNFENQVFINDFIGESILGNYFKYSNFAKSVTTLTLEDLNYAHNSLYGTERASNAITSLNESDDLFNIKKFPASYWIASKQQENDLDMYGMSQYFGIYTDSDVKLGIRPVVVLNDNLTYTKENDIWKIN